ncbi:hypothetical protein WJX74_010733 [Apatococcus lobatus]|uniref:Calmodulin n=1 Tax=Apatococcus lobatus TaxID=904363 RepID=A0AAW1S7J4_9CHLO
MTTERHKAQVPTGPSLLYHSSDKLQHLQLRVSLRRLGGGFIDRQQQSPGRLAADYDSGDDSSDVGSIDALERAAASISRLFSWQEKVYSYAESKAGQAGGQEGSRVFTYVDQDEACQDFEAGQAATTLPGDAASPLYQKVLRERSWNDKGYTSMLLMMDASDFDGGSLDQHVLAHIRAYADGSFHMRPGFSQPGDPHRFEDDMGRIYEYDLHNAADAELHPRPTTRQLLKDLTAAQRAKVLQRVRWREQFHPPALADPEAVRLLLLLDIAAAQGFPSRNVAVKWQLHWNPDLWTVISDSPGPAVPAGQLQGTTQLSRAKGWPWQRQSSSVSLAQPVELLLEAKDQPDPAHWPTLYLQVQGCDRQGRLRTEGYGWISLATVSLGMQELHVSTWRPVQPSAASTLRSVFQGGAPALMDITNVKHPRSMHPAVSTKYGLQARTSGTIQVKSCMLAQQRARSSSDPISMPLMQDQSNMQATLSRAKQRLQEASMKLKPALQVPPAATAVMPATVKNVPAASAPVTLAEPQPSATQPISNRTAPPPAKPRPEPPLITEHPAGATIESGGSVTLHVTAKGAEPLRYRWLREGLRIHTPAAHTSTLHLPALSPTAAGTFQCRVTNADGTTLSNPASVIVYPAIIQQPEPPVIEEPSPVRQLSLSSEPPEQAPLLLPEASDMAETSKANAVEEESTDPDPDEDEGTQEISDSPAKSGTASESATEPPVDVQHVEAALEESSNEDAEADPAELAAAVDDADVTAAELESLAAHESQQASEAGGEAACILVQPQDVMVHEGEEVQLSLEAGGRPSPTLQWFHGSQSLPGQTDAVLDILAAHAPDAGFYSCEVVNDLGSVMSEEALVAVLPLQPPSPDPAPESHLVPETHAEPPATPHPPEILSHPRGLDVTAGDLVELAVEVIGDSPIEYTWTRDREVLTGQSGPVLIILESAPLDSGQYMCQARNAAGHASSLPAFVVVRDAPMPLRIIQQPRDAAVTEGEAFFLWLQVEGEHPLKISWAQDGHRLDGQDNVQLHVRAARLRDAGSYVCTVSNAEGRITSEAASVSVEARLPDLEWIVQPKPQDLEAGADLHLEAVASGHAPLHYQWLCDGRPLQGWELNDITIPAVTPGDQGQYACQVKDGRGQVSTSQLAPVRVSERPLPPSIARHPEDATLSEGSQLHLVTSAEGSQPLTFTWFHAGQGLDGFSTSDLIIEPVGLHHAGGYSCRVVVLDNEASCMSDRMLTIPGKAQVSNAAGQAMSDEAWVTVEQMPAAGPVILQRPASMQVAHGQRFMISVVAEGAEPLLYSWTYNGALLDGQTDSELVVPIALKASHQGLYKAKVQNAVGEAESEDAYILVEAVDIFGMIERHLETKRMTLKSLFMQFLRSQDGVMRGQQVAAMIRHVYPNVTPAELRHFEVMVDSDGSGTMSFKELAIALKEAKAGGAYVEGATSLQTLLTQLSLRMQDQGHNFRKIWAQFDTDGDGELSYDQLLQLLHRQLPQLERSEMRQLLGYLHEIDIDGNGYLSYGELWTAIQRAPVLGQARRDMRRIAGLARTPAEKDDALRRAHTHKRTFSLKQDEFSEVVLGHAHTSLF